MVNKCVRDIMVPLDDYPLVSHDASLLEAVLKFEEAQKSRDRTRQPYRAVLVVDEEKNVVGKIGQLGFLKALEPQSNVVGDMGKLVAAGVSSDFITAMMDHYHLFRDDLSYLCKRAAYIKVKDVMHKIAENIDESASLGEAIRKFVSYQTLSIPVTSGRKIVGLLRLSDICQVVAEEMKKLTDKK